MTLATGLRCSGCGDEVAWGGVVSLCPCGQPYLVEYDIDLLRDRRPEELLRGRGLLRYAPFLPLEGEGGDVSLGEGGTPLLHLTGLGGTYGVPRLLLKDEGMNPTGSFKARGLAVAVGRARELGIREVVLSSAGNAASALAAYAARTGLRAHLFLPRDAPRVYLVEARAYGAEITLIDGLIDACGRAAAEAAAEHGWFDLSTLKEPYRVEGKKTMGLELAEALGWRLPAVIVYPTGGGTGLIGMWKAFDELERAGWVNGKRPRMVSVQAEGCAPIVRAFRDGVEWAEPWEDGETIAAGLRVPSPLGDRLILRVLRESQGTAVAVSEMEIRGAMEEMARAEGILACPEGAAAWAGLKRLLEAGEVDGQEEIVVFNTGSGLKSLELWEGGV